MAVNLIRTRHSSSKSICIPVFFALIAFGFSILLPSIIVSGAENSEISSTPRTPLITGVNGNISLQDYQKYANVEPGSFNGINPELEFEGHVSIEPQGPGASFQPVVVTFMETIETNGEDITIDVTPNSVTFSPNDNEPKPFTVNIVLKVNLSADNIFNFKIGAFAVAQFGKNQYPLEPAEGKVLVRQYHKIGINQKIGDLKMLGGTTKSFRISVSNLGNGNEGDVALTVNEEELKKGGVKVIIEPDTVRLGVRGQVDATVRVTVEEDAKDNRALFITITAKSEKGNENFPTNIKLSVDERSIIDEGWFWWIIYLAIALVIIAGLFFGVIFLKKVTSKGRERRKQRRAFKKEQKKQIRAQKKALREAKKALKQKGKGKSGGGKFKMLGRRKKKAEGPREERKLEPEPEVELKEE